MTTGTRYPMPETHPLDGSARSERRWWYVIGVLAVAALVTLAVVLFTTGDSADRDTVLPIGASTAPTAVPSAEPSAAATPAPPPASVDRATAVWPAAGGVGHSEPVSAARAFATEFLGFVSPVVGAFQQGDTRSGEVEVRPLSTGPATTVLLRQLSGEDTWSVLGATTAGISVTAPDALAVISSPVTVRGQAWTFEGHVAVQVRQDGSRAPIGEGYVTGGGDQLRAFTGSVAFSSPAQQHGSLVFLTHSAKDGSVWAASVLRVGLASGGSTAPAACEVPAGEQPGAGQMAVTAYFTCDPQGEAVPAPEPVSRLVPSSTGVLAASMTALIGGPTTAEADAGMSSFFSSATAGMLNGVTLTDGHAVVDFGDLPSVIPNASTSAGSALLLSELDATAFQFSTVQSAEYRIDGSCTAFTEWLQGSGCEPRTR